MERVELAGDELPERVAHAPVGVLVPEGGPAGLRVRQAHVDVAGIAREILVQLGHEGRRHARLGGKLFHRGLEPDNGIGHAQRIRRAQVCLELALAPFRRAAFDLVGERVAQSPDDRFPEMTLVNRVAVDILRDELRHAPLAGTEFLRLHRQQEELELEAALDRESELCCALDLALQLGARAQIRPAAVRHPEVHVDDRGVLLPAGDAETRQVGGAHHVGNAGRKEMRQHVVDRRRIEDERGEIDAVRRRVAEKGNGQALAALHAARIGRRHNHRPDAVSFDQRLDRLQIHRFFPCPGGCVIARHRRAAP